MHRERQRERQRGFIQGCAYMYMYICIFTYLLRVVVMVLSKRPVLPKKASTVEMDKPQRRRRSMLVVLAPFPAPWWCVFILDLVVCLCVFNVLIRCVCPSCSTSEKSGGPRMCVCTREESCCVCICVRGRGVGTVIWTWSSCIMWCGIKLIVGTYKEEEENRRRRVSLCHLHLPCGSSFWLNINKAKILFQANEFEKKTKTITMGMIF